MKQAVTFLVGLSAVGVMVASYLPSPAEDAAHRRSEAKTFHTSPNAWSNDKVIEAARAGEWHGEVRLERQPDGQFYAEATVGGVPFKVVIDTGADVVALPGEDARKIGLEWREDEIQVIGRGASGEVRGVVRKVPSLSVQGMTVQDVTVVVIPEGLHVALLGQNYLSQITSVNLQGDTMVLSNL